MHYGREFLSVGMWDSDKAQHLRETCARVRPAFLYTPERATLTDSELQTLGTWGMGSA